MDSFTTSTYTPVPENRMESEQQQYDVHSSSVNLNANTVISSIISKSLDNTAEISLSASINNSSVNYSNLVMGSQQQQQQYMKQMALMPSQVALQTLSNEALLALPQNKNVFHEINGIQTQPYMISRQFDHQINELSPSQSPAPNHTHFYSNIDSQSLYYLDPTMNTQQRYNMYPGSFSNSPIPFNYLSSQQATIPLINNIYSQMSHSSIPHVYIPNQANIFYDKNDSAHSLSAKMDHSNPVIVNNLTSKPVLFLNQKNNNKNNNDLTFGNEKIISSPTIPPNQSISSISNPDSTSKMDHSFLPDQQTSVSVTVTYIPKTRHVETYGGVDMKYFEKFEIKQSVPYFKELGEVDIYAIMMSLKSNMKMEVTNALNILTTITSLAYPIYLIHCEDLLDIILNRFECCIFECLKYSNIDKKVKYNSRTDIITNNGESLYSELFESSLLEMKSLIPLLEQSSSDTLLSLREEAYSILNILRNLSFMQENIDYLANHHQFITVLVNTLKSTQSLQNNSYIRQSDKNDFINSDNMIRNSDILDIRKSILIIFANISIAVTALKKQKDSVEYILNFVCDFLISDSNTYYSFLAMEIWNKLLVHEDNRQFITDLLTMNHHHLSTTTAPLSSLSSNQQILLRIWKSLISLIRCQFYYIAMGMYSGISNNQLATLEMTMMGLYNVAALSDITFCQYLIKEEDGIAMTILRMCITLAEFNNKHFRVVAQRGMETVYTLMLGGGVKVTQLIKNQRQHQRIEQNKKQNTLFPISYLDLGDEGVRYKQDIKYNTQKLLNQSIINEKLMIAMLNPSSDQFIIAGLINILSFVEEVIYTE